MHVNALINRLNIYKGQFQDVWWIFDPLCLNLWVSKFFALENIGNVIYKFLGMRIDVAHVNVLGIFG